ncbi:MAG: hypothetical protein JWO51_39 [Rhodospirillales bacterium]|nr:hypothetical protein [Rhodospirillales bacterium]
MNLDRIMLAVVCGLTLFGTTAGAQQFSADLVDLNADGSRREPGEGGQLFVAGDKVRIDRTEASRTRFLVDADKGTAYAVAPMQRLYMDAKQSSILTELMVPVDPSNPCVRWQAMASVAGDPTGQWQCEQAGSEDLDGRTAVKVMMISPTGVKRTGWIDATLKFPLKFQTADGAIIALRNIVEAPQPARLFVIAGSFRKYDPAQLIARIKQSDVWVEPVK